jgi:hypothetical protein
MCTQDIDFTLKEITRSMALFLLCRQASGCIDDAFNLKSLHLDLLKTHVIFLANQELRFSRL